MTLLRPTLQGRKGYNPNGYGPGVNAPFGRSKIYFNGTRYHNGQDYFWLNATSAQRLNISQAASKNVYPVMDGKVVPINDSSLGTGAWQQIDSEHRFYYWHMSKRIYGSARNMRTVDRIGIMGRTGTAAGSGDHVHVEVRKAPYRAQDRIDPEPFFKKLSAAQKARYRKIGTFLNTHAKNLGRVGTTTASDGIPGANYWFLVQALGRAWKFYSGTVDGKPGPLDIRRREAHLGQVRQQARTKAGADPGAGHARPCEPAHATGARRTGRTRDRTRAGAAGRRTGGPVTPTPDPVDDIVSQPIPDQPEGAPEPDPQHAARREALVRRIFTAIADVIRGRRTVGELAIATLRTVVPFVYSWVIVWTTTNVSWLDWLAYVPADIALEAQSAAVIALGTGIYALLRKLAQRWPNLERFLGSEDAELQRIVETIVVATLSGFALVVAALLTYLTAQMTSLRKRLDATERANHLLWVYCRKLMDHIYRGLPPPPPPADDLDHLFDRGLTTLNDCAPALQLSSCRCGGAFRARPEGATCRAWPRATGQSWASTASRKASNSAVCFLVKITAFSSFSASWSRPTPPELRPTSPETLSARKPFTSIVAGRICTPPISAAGWSSRPCSRCPSW